MKRSLSIFFLGVLAFPVIFKIGVIGVYQFNREYIVENYCVNKDRPITMCYGRCFLQKGLELADKTSDPAYIIAKLKFESSNFLVDNFVLTPLVDEVISDISFSQVQSTNKGVPSFLLRPPIV